MSYNEYKEECKDPTAGAKLTKPFQRYNGTQIEDRQIHKEREATAGIKDERAFAKAIVALHLG
jgi:hypothetical protein